MNLSSALSLYVPPARGLRGLADLSELDLTQIISRGIDVVGSAVAKAPSMYVSPNDPRFNQPPQNVYVYPMNPAPTPPMAATNRMPDSGAGVGFKIDQKTLILAAGAILIFMVASKR